MKDSRSDVEKQYDTGMLPDSELHKLIKILKQERDYSQFNWQQCEKENKKLHQELSKE